MEPRFSALRADSLPSELQGSLTLACPYPRISRATEALQTFRPAASSSFRHCQLDVGREMKLLTELNFLRGEEMARPHVQLEPSSLFPSSGPGGQCPPGNELPSLPAGLASRPAHLAHPATPSHRAQRCFSLSLFVGCGHRGLCSGAPQASQRPCPGGPAPSARSPALPCPSHAARLPTHGFLLFPALTRPPPPSSSLASALVSLTL